MVLLIDEIDRVEVEAEALMLEVLTDFQVTIPELGTMQATRRPMVFLTSNDTRDLSEALKRRCLYLHIDYPTIEREREILLARVDGLTPDLAAQVAGSSPRSGTWTSRSRRPSRSRSTGRARSSCSGSRASGPEDVGETLHVLLKYEADIERARRRLAGLPVEGDEPAPHIDAFRAPEGTPG